MKFKLVFCVVPDGGGLPPAEEWHQIKVEFEGHPQKLEPINQVRLGPNEEIEALGHQVARFVAAELAKSEAVAA